MGRRIVPAALALAVFGLSLGLKVLATPFATGRPATTLPQSESLRRFLVAQTGYPVEAVGTGWRIPGQGCSVLAFPSGAHDDLDFEAQSHAQMSDRLLYVYRGRVLSEPPRLAFALDVVLHFLRRPSQRGNDAGYVVLVVPRDCATAPSLAWDRLPVS